MEKFFILFVVIIGLSGENILGQNVALETAKKAAINYYIGHFPTQLMEAPSIDEIEITDLSVYQENNINYYYTFIFNEDKGFVITSADKRYYPVLGHSYEETPDPDEKMPPPVKAWMKQYVGQIKYIRKNQITPSSKIKNLWEDLLITQKSTQLGSKSTNTTDITLDTPPWGQGWSYNDQCPEVIIEDENENKDTLNTLVGCCGVAMGIAMGYYQWPKTGLGDTSYTDTVTVNFGNSTYNWNGISQSNDWGITEANLGEGPEFLFHCAASVGTSFGPYSSGSFPSRIPYALEHHFRYQPTTKYIIRENYSDSKWKSILRNEIDEGKPMVYSGGGHAFVFDGYRTGTEEFHFNWGWNGDYIGWFYLNDLTPGEPGEHNYNDYQKAVTGIRPYYFTDFPYTTGFESGLDDCWFTRSSDDEGRIAITSGYSPYEGNNHLIMDVEQSGTYNKNEAVLTINLEGADIPMLTFYWKEFSDEGHSQDGIYFSNDGFNYSKVYELKGNEGSWEKASLNINNLASQNGLETGKSFYIKFQQYDNYPITTDGFAFDKISVDEKPFPDLTPYSCAASPTKVPPGGTVTASCYLKNQGEAQAGSSVMKFWLSDDLSYSGDDDYMGSENIGSIAPGEQTYIEKDLPLPFGIDDSYHILFLADAEDDIDEHNNEGNNWCCSNSILVSDFLKSTKVYPNPATSEVNIELPVNDVRYDISFYSMQGQNMKSLSTMKRLTRINVSELSPGMYMIKIKVLGIEIIKQLEIVR